MTKTLNELIAESMDLKRQIDEHTRAATNLGAQRDAVLAKILEKMDEDGLQRTGTDVANVLVSETIVPTVNDWDAFYNFIRENDAMHLLQRRVTSTSYREYIDAGQEVPGVVPFTKRSVQVRSR